ncbi:hypothetical protein MTR67_048932 [Solanum verrucosum]|uniref:Uncharacterized protein n=1 Tax=Solanum verrucosum TaxID=315347 RepID=A0AAF0ZWZ7_SOLVR|nr:hypothetical protein MTR67_048932 [Solanum verrucosum]
MPFCPFSMLDVQFNTLFESVNALQDWVKVMQGSHSSMVSSICRMITLQDEMQSDSTALDTPDISVPKGQKWPSLFPRSHVHRLQQHRLSSGDRRPATKSSMQQPPVDQQAAATQQPTFPVSTQPGASREQIIDHFPLPPTTIGDHCGGWVETEEETSIRNHLKWARLRICGDGSNIPREIKIENGGLVFTMQIWVETPAKVEAGEDKQNRSFNPLVGSNNFCL